MKKIGIITVLASSPLAMFAYYDDYGTTDTAGSNWLTFLMIILFVWGILEVILFFKVWGMTNNVKDMKKHLVRSNKRDEFRKFRLLGQKEKAAEALIEVFLDSMIVYIHSEDYDPSRNIEQEISELENQLSQFGVKIPKEIKALKTARNFWNAGFVIPAKAETTKADEKQKTKEEKQIEEVNNYYSEMN